MYYYILCVGISIQFRQDTDSGLEVLGDALRRVLVSAIQIDSRVEDK